MIYLFCNKFYIWYAKNFYFTIILALIYCKLHFSVINDHFIVIISISYHFKIHQLRFLFNDIMFCIFIIPQQVCIKEKFASIYIYCQTFKWDQRKKRKKRMKTSPFFYCRHTLYINVYRPKQTTSSINIIITFEFVLQKQKK